MFKGQERIWLYLIGIIIMFAVLVFASQNFTLPFFQGRLNIGSNNKVIRKPDFKIDLKKNYFAEINTNHGTITVDLFEKNSPNNVNNFAYLSDQKFYENTKFHRLIPSLLLQGGDRNTLDNDASNDGKGNPGYLLDDEINFKSLNLSNERIKQLESEGYKSNSKVASRLLEKYAMVMASAGPNTNGSQFFFVIAEASDERIKLMNGKFTVVGIITSGKDVLDKIANFQVENPTSIAPRPLDEIVLRNVRVFTN